MYRPAVQYDDDYRTFVSEVSKSTQLDRQQIIRAALFIAAHSLEYQMLLVPYLKEHMKLPIPNWTVDDHNMWLNQPIDPKKENDKSGHKKEISEYKSSISNEPKTELPIKYVFKQQGGIKFKVG
ncbi:hypothetical protein BKP35_16375 [Anaerobacillus arseniciselenatis]|uniref:Uncharacterized protein n=1 Tax=Anaerobacillus arseniciselenatis TaxID=85682 RepID=A0A1S2LAC7_9BACI|nr:hypothetical protein [Anaerobacillus arseniciselenatis]OIJ09429.1 hypothetical protein BKP35_16375 [Anaerobacillus arseniciselenatis]